MKLDFNLGKRHFHLSFRTHRELNQYVGGITNRCRDGRYVLFLDYDRVPVEWVTEELYFLLDKYALGRVHLFETNGGWHAISTKKMSLKELLTVMMDSSTDAAYIWISLRRARKVWTLRMTEKNGVRPKYFDTFNGAGKGEESAPHNEFLRKIYNIRIPQDHPEDGEQDFWTAHYHIAGDER